MKVAALVAVLASGCEFMDIGKPIALVFDGITDEHRANVIEAARCWNLQFGTQFVVDEEAAQQVEVFYDKQTCFSGVAQVQAGWPMRLAVCPEEYWLGVFQQRYYPVTPFRVFGHELGHTLNIIEHPKDARAVMNAGGTPFSPMFHDDDFTSLQSANPDFAIPLSSCRRVVRSMIPNTNARIGRCACETDAELDLARPIAIALADGEFTAAKATSMQRAATCWNVRYGLALEVRAPADGDQVAYVEPTHPDEPNDECYSPFDQNRSHEGDTVVTCANVDADDTPDIALVRATVDIAHILGVLYASKSTVDGVFKPRDAIEFAKVYPKQPLACTNVVLDAGGNCVCGD